VVSQRAAGVRTQIAALELPAPLAASADASPRGYHWGGPVRRMLPATVMTDSGGGGGGGGGRRGERRAAFDPERPTCAHDGGRVESIYNLLPRLKEEPVRSDLRLFGAGYWIRCSNCCSTLYLYPFRDGIILPSDVP